MNARYEVHPAEHHPAVGPTYAGGEEAFWHKRAANGQITSTSEVFTRHGDAVRGIRTDLETTAEILGISRGSFEKLYAPDLTYFDAVYGDEAAYPSYDEKPLYTSPPFQDDDELEAVADV